MNNNKFKLAIVFSLIIATAGCSILDSRPATKQGLTDDLDVQLTRYLASDFKQVSARFTVNKSKELVFRVLSSFEQTPQWLVEVDNIETLSIYSNSHFLLRTVINSPWPFKQRELITCVETSFEPTVTIIDVRSCSERWPLDQQYVRVSDVASRWVITATSQSSAQVSYQAWLDPQGYVPTFFFNQQLKQTTEKSLHRLQQIIADSTLGQYAY